LYRIAQGQEYSLFSFPGSWAADDSLEVAAGLRLLDGVGVIILPRLLMQTFSKKLWVTVASALMLYLLPGVSKLSAQGGGANGSINITVTDPSAAAIPSA